MGSVLRTLLASSVILAAGVATLHHTTDGFRSFTAESARRLAVARTPEPVPAIALERSDGSHLSLDTERGRWLVVDFIYTHCATQCTLQGMVFARMQDSLSAEIADGSVRLLSLSFDPTRDDPAALRGYLTAHGAQSPGWQAARPVDAANLATMRERFGLIVIPDQAGGFEHNAATMIIDPAGRLVNIRDWNDDAGTVRFIREQLAS